MADVNECASAATHGCDKEYGTCSNTPGGYTCSCNKGFTGTGYVCAGKMRYSTLDFSQMRVYSIHISLTSVYQKMKLLLCIALQRKSKLYL